MHDSDAADDDGYRGRRQSGQQSSSAAGSSQMYDGKRARKPVVRKTIDYHSSVIQHLTHRYYAANTYHTQTFLPPTVDAAPFLTTLYPNAIPHHPQLSTAQGFCTKYIAQSVNKARTSIICVSFTPDTRRIVTGAASGELTLWNGLTFNFETILQGHDDAVRCQAWGGNGSHGILASGDDSGIVKLWQTSMNNLKAFHAHKSVVRELSWAPSHSCSKLATCSDDHTISIWDVESGREESQFTQHGWDVKSIHYHPSLSLLASASKDKLIKLWDPRNHQAPELQSLHGHKDTINTIKWNQNGYWLVSGGRDRVIKVWELRMCKELVTYRGSEKEITALIWHPCIEHLCISGSFDGDIRYWSLLEDPQNYVAEITTAHDKEINDLIMHPLGHLLVSASSDQLIRYWCRNKPGDELTDKYNVKSLPAQNKAEALMELVEAQRMNPTQPGTYPSLPGMHTSQQQPLLSLPSLSQQQQQQHQQQVPLGYAVEGRERVEEREQLQQQQRLLEEQRRVEQSVREAAVRNERERQERERMEQDRMDADRIEREQYQNAMQRMQQQRSGGVGAGAARPPPVTSAGGYSERERYEREMMQRQRRGGGRGGSQR